MIPHGFKERTQGAEDGDTDGNGKHAKGERPLLFVSVVQFVPETFTWTLNL